MILGALTTCFFSHNLFCIGSQVLHANDEPLSVAEEGSGNMPVKPTRVKFRQRPTDSDYKERISPAEFSHRDFSNCASLHR
jgi:hypothetical protein